LLKEELRALVSGDSNLDQQHNSPNKIARAAIFLLHRALRDKVYAVYSLAAEAIRAFFTEFVPARYRVFWRTETVKLLAYCIIKIE
jgi:centrosomal protein CEP104